MSDRLEGGAGPQGRAALLERALAGLLGEVLLWDRSSRLIFASPSALLRLGLAPGLDLRGRCCAELPVTEPLRDVLAEVVAAALGGESTARRLGPHLSLAGRPLPDVSGVAWAALIWLRPAVVMGELDATPLPDVEATAWEAARAQLEAAIVAVSRGLVDCAPTAIDAAIVGALRAIAEVLGADSAVLLCGGRDGGVAGALASTHRWGGDPDEALVLPVEPLRALLASEPLLALPDLANLGAPAALRAALVDAPRSLVFAPVQDGTLIGGLLLRWSSALARPWPPLGTLVVLADLLLAVLRRAHAEEALMRSEANLRRAQGLARIGSYTFDLSGGASQWSDEARRIIGFAPEAAALELEETLQRFVHPDDRESVRTDMARLIAEGGILEREFRALPLQGPPSEVHIVTEAQRDGGGVRPR